MEEKIRKEMCTDTYKKLYKISDSDWRMHFTSFTFFLLSYWREAMVYKTCELPITDIILDSFKQT